MILEILSICIYFENGYNYLFPLALHFEISNSEMAESTKLTTNFIELVFIPIITNLF